MILKNGKRIDGCSDTVPIGSINPFVGTEAPYGYLLCQGQKVSKTTYPELYKLCKSIFGTETTTEFYLPDLRGKVIAGYKEGDSTFGTLAAVIGATLNKFTPKGTNSGTAVILNAINLSHSGGSVQSHTLTVDEMPSHTHHFFRGTNGTDYFGVTGKEPNGNTPYQVDTSSSGGGQGHSHGFTQPSAHSFTPTTKSITQPTFTGQESSISTVQPTVVLNWIVKAINLMPNQSYVSNMQSDSDINTYSCDYINSIQRDLDGRLTSGFSSLQTSISSLDTRLTEHTHNKITSTLETHTHINGNKGAAIINSTAPAGYNMLARMKSKNGVFTFGMWNASFDFFYTSDSVISANTNSFTKRVILLDEDGNTLFPGNVAATKFNNYVLNEACTRGVTGAHEVTHTNFGTNNGYLPTMSFLAYWNGAYSKNNASNLRYCAEGPIENTNHTSRIGHYVDLSFTRHKQTFTAWNAGRITGTALNGSNGDTLVHDNEGIKATRACTVLVTATLVIYSAADNTDNILRIMKNSDYVVGTYETKSLYWRSLVATRPVKLAAGDHLYMEYTTGGAGEYEILGESAFYAVVLNT